MKKFLVFTCTILSLLSCQSKEEKVDEYLNEQVRKILDIAFKNRTKIEEISESGSVVGDADMTFYSDNVKIVMDYEDYGLGMATESGPLKNLSFKESCGFEDCSDQYNYSIQGEWYRDSGLPGQFVCTANKQNQVEFFFFAPSGGNWKHYMLINVKDINPILKAFREIKKEIKEI